VSGILYFFLDIGFIVWYRRFHLVRRGDAFMRRRGGGTDRGAGRRCGPRPRWPGAREIRAFGRSGARGRGKRIPRTRAAFGLRPGLLWTPAGSRLTEEADAPLERACTSDESAAGRRKTPLTARREAPRRPERECVSFYEKTPRLRRAVFPSSRGMRRKVLKPRGVLRSRERWRLSENRIGGRERTQAFAPPLRHRNGRKDPASGKSG
jgi:hypothetical protein